MSLIRLILDAIGRPRQNPIEYADLLTMPLCVWTKELRLDLERGLEYPFKPEQVFFASCRRKVVAMHRQQDAFLRVSEVAG